MIICSQLTIPNVNPAVQIFSATQRLKLRVYVQSGSIWLGTDPSVTTSTGFRYDGNFFSLIPFIDMERGDSLFGITDGVPITAWLFVQI